MEAVTGIVLAGGQGRRMGGVDKGLQSLDGRPMVAWAIERLAPQVDEILLNANQNAEAYARFGYRVVPERIAPGKPQQNGRHERLHLTLKQDTASPPARSLAEQLERFEAFCRIYNEERPHEALGQETPARHWQPSPRRWDGCLRSPDYAGDTQVRRVRHDGTIKWQGRHLFLSETLKGEPVKLTAQEYKLLSYLMHHKGKVVSRTELIEHIYDQDFDRDSNTIEVFVTRIRKKLGAEVITTIRGLGYSLDDPEEAPRA